MAMDLRFITSAMKIITDLERMGDQAVNIAERAVSLNQEPQLRPYFDIPRMAEVAQSMVKDVLDAFVNRDPKLARSVCERDDLVDGLNDQVVKELLTYMMSDAKAISQEVHLMIIARSLERIADHATNIAEDIIFWVRGLDVRHGRGFSVRPETAVTAISEDEGLTQNSQVLHSGVTPECETGRA